MPRTAGLLSEADSLEPGWYTWASPTNSARGRCFPCCGRKCWAWANRSTA
ncbi:Uncharacterised protein [Bordetella pertussis]|nr:Uncharacterised protein [Bordetella pertussis]